MKRLFIDLAKCDACETCKVSCGAFYRASAADHGVLSLRERAQFSVVCRRCEDASCVAACKFEALERQADGVLKRHNMRCVSCQCCSQACPFGTIYPETVPFYVTLCDSCMAVADGEPRCVVHCAKQAIEYKDVQESEKDNVFLVGDNLAVRAPRWNKKAV